MALPYLIVLLGPTAVGKTSWAIHIAKHFNTEIISADSRQFYKEMHIGTAVPSWKELNSVRHYFIQHKSIEEEYNVGAWVEDATALLNEKFVHHKVLVLTGGSGLYIHALLHGLDAFPEIDPGIRHKLNKTVEREGLKSLQQRLKEVDPVTYGQIDLNNPHRVIRALEISLGSGKPYSSFLGKNKPVHAFQPLLIGLDMDRDRLYKRIDSRVDQMIRGGLVEEARGLYASRHLNALQTVGYRELFAYFDGDITLDTAIAEIKKNTRRYAKRQLTWLRKRTEIQWFAAETAPELVFRYLKEQMR